MSRRFGRNQRRRAREQLEQATRAAFTLKLQRDTAERNELAALKEATLYRAQVMAVREGLGEHTALLPATLLVGAGYSPGLPTLTRAPVQRWADCIPWDIPDSQLNDAKQTVQLHTLDVLELETRGDHHALNEHFYLRHRGVHVAAYAVDRRTLQRLKSEGKPRLVRYIAEALATMLANQLDNGSIDLGEP